MDKDEVSRLIKENYTVLTTEYSVSRIAFFGSVAQGTMTEQSDLDILVEFKGPIGFKFCRLVEYFEKLFGKKVDVITKAGIENIRIKEVTKNIERDLTYVEA